jgi:hypothetical protein
VIFDTWIRNHDRWPPEGDDIDRASLDNPFFTPEGRKYDLVALDHSHCFIDGDLEASLRDDYALGDDRLCGLFPEIAPFIDEATVLEAVDQLARVEVATVRQIMGSVPLVWGPSTVAREAWVDFIMARARLVTSFAPGILLAQGRLRV